MTDPRHPHDVDALARRLPHPEPGAERSAAMRHAVLEAAQGQVAPRARGPVRSWWLGLAAAAATVCVWLALRTPGRPQPSAPTASGAASPTAAATAATTSTATAATAGIATAPAATAPTAASAAAVDSATTAAAAGSAAPAPAAERERIPEGVTAFATARPLYLGRGDATITAPPDARFDVEVRGDEVKRVTVTAGWVVVAGAHTRATIVSMHHTWTPEPPAPAPTPAATTDPRANRSLAAPAASREPAKEPPAAPMAPAERPQPRAAEQDFRDGLRTLLAGDPRGATQALDRACGAPSSTQDDSCYWAAVAWLRSSDHARARRAFTEMLSRWPGSTHVGEANLALGWLLLESGDRSAARTRFAAAADDRMPNVRASAVRGLAASQ